MDEIEIGGVTYQLGKLNAFEQVHVMRRLLPLLTEIGRGTMAARQLMIEHGGLPAPPNGAAVPGDGAEPVGFDPGAEEEVVAVDNDLQEGFALTALSPVARVLADMDDKVVEYVMRSCLGKVRRRTPNGWAPVMVAGRFQFEADMDASVLMQLTYAMVDGQLGGFWPGSPDQPSAAVSR